MLIISHSQFLHDCQGLSLGCQNRFAPNTACDSHSTKGSLDRWLMSVGTYWNNTEVCVLHCFSEFSEGLSISCLCGEYLHNISFIACLFSPMSTSVVSCSFQITNLLSNPCLDYGSGGTKLWWSSTFDNYKHAGTFFSVEGVCSLSQVLKGICDSSHMMHSSANTFFLSLTISFSLPPCNSLFSKASQYFSLAVQPIYRKESEKHAH